MPTQRTNNQAASSSSGSGSTPTSDAMVVTVQPSARASYVASGFFTLPAAATDVAYLKGSASKTIHITRLQIGIIATSAAQGLVAVRKKSVAPTGGTSSNLTAFPIDSASAAATAVLPVYTVNPVTVGTNVGDIKNYPTFIAALATGAPQILDIDFLPYYPAKQGLTLRGVAECVAVGLGGATYSGGVMNVNWEWTEDDG